MKYLIITGNHPRHIYYANSIIRYCNVEGVILEERELFLPEPSSTIKEKDRKNFAKHFQNREKYEIKYFEEEKQLLDSATLYIKDNIVCLNESIDFVNEINPDIIFVFGVLNFAKKLREKSDKSIKYINLNTGLIQRYNGDATLFWPFYFLEPNWAGSTFHLIADEPDVGDIIHQSVPKLKYGDTIHEVACKVVKESAEDIKKIIDILESGKKLKLHKQIRREKKFLSRDFIPQHLRVIYDLYNDNIVDEFLDGKLSSKNPKLLVLDSF